MDYLRPASYQAVVMGASSGGLEAFITILQKLPATFKLPILIAQHLHQRSESLLADILSEKTKLKVKEAEDKEQIQSGMIYIAPPGYHLLVEPDKTLALSVDEFINFSRPSIDVLFESAATVFQNNLIGVLLTGANEDGARGLRTISEKGGLIMVQDPKEASMNMMPSAGLKYTQTQNVFRLEQIADFLISKNYF